MKRCPKCYTAPGWHSAGNTTRKRGDGRHYFAFSGCPHAMDLAKIWGLVPREELPTFEASWEAEAERLFAKVTERWTEPQRVSFRVRLLWVTPARELDLAEPSAPSDVKREEDGEAF